MTFIIGISSTVVPPSTMLKTLGVRKWIWWKISGNITITGDITLPNGIIKASQMRIIGPANVHLSGTLTLKRNLIISPPRMRSVEFNPHKGIRVITN